MNSLALQRLVGQGNSADVFLGTLAGQRVAVKRLRNPRSHKAAASLVREAQTLAELPRHDNVVAYLAALERESKLYLVMEHVDGVPLGKLLERGRLPLNASIYVIKQILAGLACVHTAGKVHRDLSPSNILIATDGTVKIADFGLARTIGRSITATAVQGTLDYLSPEQARGKAANVRSDLFSVGAIFFELLTGETPFQGTLAEVYTKLMSSAPAKTPSSVEPMIPSELVDVVNKLLAKDPNKRYGSATEVASDLPSEFAGRTELLLASKRVLASALSRSNASPRNSRRDVIMVVAAASIAAVMVLALSRTPVRTTALSPTVKVDSSIKAVETRQLKSHPVPPKKLDTPIVESKTASKAQPSAKPAEIATKSTKTKNKKPAKQRSKRTLRKKAPKTRPKQAASHDDSESEMLTTINKTLQNTEKQRGPHWYPVRIVESDEVPLPSHK